ncbi:MAG TPA: hypothetical protein VG733_07140, partial [Chthoniobacteraceae bacterium]|nr:hypothetical protein [Chthoniobacteraceae bacterium]
LQGRDYLMSHPASPYFGLESNPPTDWKPAYSGQFYIPLRDLIVPAILRAAKAADPRTGRALFPKGILIFVHGGNNEISGAIEKTESLIDTICKDGYYPLFVCWNSDMVSTWWEHVRFVRNGVDLRGDPGSRLYGEITWPLYAATDFATAAARLPRTVADNLYSAGKGSIDRDMRESYATVQNAEYRYSVLRARMGSVPENARPAELNGWFAHNPSNTALKERMIEKYNPDAHSEKLPASDPHEKFEIAWDANWKKWQAKHPNALPMLVTQGEAKQTFVDDLSRVVGFPLGIGGKLLVAGTLEGAGESMWNMMTRRTRTMFYNSNSFQPGHRASYDEYEQEFWDSSDTGIGGFAVFLRQLEKENKKSGARLKVTAVGHSMGAMVMNEAVRYFPNVYYDRIVYMAPACTISDFYNSVVPYLRHPPYGKSQHVEFFNLCLNPLAEDRERSLVNDRNTLEEMTLGEIVPRGSLLVWIDDWFNHPDSFPDRTLGQFENAMLASKMFPPDVQGKIHMLAFGMDPASKPGGPTDPGPEHHGDFSGYKFWEKEFYTEDVNLPRGEFKAGD